jgi:beta-galactosidase
VTAQLRTDGTTRYVFLMNFNRHPVEVKLDAPYVDVLRDRTVAGSVAMERYGVRVLRR